VSEYIEEAEAMQRDGGARHIGSVAAGEEHDHVWRALHGPEPKHIVLGDRNPPLQVVHVPPVYPGGWKPE
jgi:hypothetical protein